MTEKGRSDWPGHKLSFAFGLVSGVTLFLVVLFIIAMVLSGQNQMGAIPPDLKGVFYGQVVNILSLDPIPMAIVHFCRGQTLDTLITTVTTDVFGYYETTNITLPSGNLFISAEAPGYYTEPLGFSQFSQETVNQVNSSAYSVYSVTPIKLFRVSTNERMAIQLIPSLGNIITVDTTNNYTYQLANSLRLEFNVIMWNNLPNTAAGSPYFGNTLQITATPNFSSVYPYTPLPELSLIYGNNGQWYPQTGQHFSMVFAAYGLTRVALLLTENPYLSFYGETQHLSVEFDFWVNVTGWS
jgi:hypothetical protein